MKDFRVLQQFTDTDLLSELFNRRSSAEEILNRNEDLTRYQIIYLMIQKGWHEDSRKGHSTEEVKKICPDCKVEEKGDKIIITDDGTKEIADLIEGIANKADKKAEVEVEKELVITLESFGQMDLKDIFTKSVDALKKDLAEVSKKVK